MGRLRQLNPSPALSTSKKMPFLVFKSRVLTLHGENNAAGAFQPREGHRSLRARGRSGLLPPEKFPWALATAERFCF